jgi:hypothetical protein
MTSPPCLSQKTSQPATNAVERTVPRKLATEESSAPLRTRIEFTPHRQFATHQLGAFAHALQTVVSGASLFIKMLRVNTLPVILDSQPQLPFVIPNFHFDPLGLCVLEGIAQGFAGYR